MFFRQFSLHFHPFKKKRLLLRVSPHSWNQRKTQFGARQKIRRTENLEVIICGAYTQKPQEKWRHYSFSVLAIEFFRPFIFSSAAYSYYVEGRSQTRLSMICLIMSLFLQMHLSYFLPMPLASATYITNARVNIREYTNCRGRLRGCPIFAREPKATSKS